MGRTHRPGAAQPLHRCLAWPRKRADRGPRDRGAEILASGGTPGLRYCAGIRGRERGPDRFGFAGGRDRAPHGGLMAVMKPRPAATLALMRERNGAIEVLMLQRTQSAAFLGGAYVFAGGALDPVDEDGRIVARVRGLGMPTPPVAYWVAAIRECFEEAGILLACDAQGQFVSAERAASLAHYRKRPFVELLQGEDLYVPAAELAYFGHWITAPGRARRFDTRFFVAVAPEGQEGSHDANETVHHMWVSPREALAKGERGEIELVFATQTSLRDLGRFDAPRAAFEYA